jgi:Ca2+-binding RTX toxin-like protein
MIVATANNGVGVYATHVYSAAAVHDIVVTATDKDGGVGSVVHKINVAEISTEGLQNVIDETVASGEDAVIELEATSNSDLGSIIGSASQLTVDSGTFDIVVDMDGGNFHGQSINLPSGVNLVLQDGSLEGASPALTVTAGNVVVTGVTFTNVTDAPTILVHGGHLTLRGSTVEETTGGNQAGIEITGGTVDLGSTADPGANTFVVHQTGQAIRNTGSAMVTSIGNAFQGNDGISVTTVTSPFDIEDQIQHALDAGAGGVVEYVVDNVYVTQQSGSIQRGVDAVVGGGTVHVQQGNFAAYDAGDKLLTLAFQAGPVVRQEQDTLDASLRTVVVTGTNQDDNIHFGQGKASGAVDVSVNGVATGRFQPTGRLVAFGQAGNDDIQVTGGTVLSAWLYGDAGNDRLKGGAGHDAIFGGDGDDLLIGKSGRDLMIGGAGADRIIGNADDDILIAGATTFDLVAGSHSNVAHEQSIFDVMAEWTSDRDYEIRVANLTGDDSATADRQNGDTFLNAATVSDDDEKDVLTGSAGSDWFFMDAQQDRATDLKDEIFANDLDFILS